MTLGANARTEATLFAVVVIVIVVRPFSPLMQSPKHYKETKC